MPHVLPLVDGPVYGTPLTLALVEPKLDEHGIDGARRLRDRPAARARDDRAVHDRVHPRHAQHARLRRAGDPHAGRRHRPHRRLQDRSDADRRRALRRPPLRRARRRRACWRCSPTARTSIAAASPARRSRSSTRSRRSSPARPGKLVVAAFASSIYRMQILVDLAAQFDRKVAFVGRGMIAELARSRSGSATCAFRPACRSATRTSATIRRRTCCASRPARRASRCRRCRASRSTITAT